MKHALAVFVTDQCVICYQSYKQRQDDISFLLNHLIVEVLQEYCVTDCLRDISIKHDKLYTADPTDMVIQKGLFNHYPNLDDYIRHLRSGLYDKLITAVYKLYRDRRFTLYVDYTFISEVTTLITFNFVRKEPPCALLR